MPKIGNFPNLLVLAGAQPVLSRAQPVPVCSACAHSSKPSFWRKAFPCINSSQNWWYLARNAQSLKFLEFRIFGDPELLFWEGVTFLYKFFTKSVISGSKCPKWKISQICSCLLVLSLCLLVLSLCLRAQPVLTPQNPVLGGCQISFVINSSQNW